MIFNKYNNCKEFSNERISLEELIATIKNHPMKKQITTLRNLEYKSVQYDKLKLQLPVVTPHGTFSSSKKESLEQLSGFLYFDIDGFITSNEVDDTIQKLNDAFSITLICKSCGGKGLAFLLKVNGVTLNNFVTAHAFIRHTFQTMGYNIDDAAGGLIRKWIISHDTDVIYNKDAEYEIDVAAYEKFMNASKTTPKKVKKNEPDSDADDESDIIPFDTLCKMIKTESQFNGNIEGDFIIQEMEFYRICLPKKIKDGTKHRTYTRIIHALYYLNESINQHQVFSYIFYINRNAEAKMSKFKLKTFVTYICNKIEETGEILIKTRIKKIHFNENLELNKNQKQSVAAKIHGTHRSNKTKESIRQTIAYLEENNIKVTKKRIAQELKIDVKTVQRNWKKDLVEISSLDFTLKNEPKKIISNLSEFDYEEDYISGESEKSCADDTDFWND